MVNSDLSSISFNDDDIVNLEKVLPIFESSQPEISDHICDIFYSHIFDNTHTLHPRQLSSYAREETDSIIEFLKTLQVLPPGTKHLIVDENGHEKAWPPSG